MVESKMNEAASKSDKVINYSISAEPQQTEEHRLTGREILERAGFSPAEDYTLTRDDGNKVINLDDRESIHQDERFTATFKGITPTS
jgi:hypothetical protein